MGNVPFFHDEEYLQRHSLSRDRWHLLELGWNGDYYDFMNGKHEKITSDKIILLGTPELFIIPSSAPSELYRGLVERYATTGANSFISGHSFEFDISLIFDIKSSSSTNRSLSSLKTLSVQYLKLDDILYSTNQSRIREGRAISGSF